MTSVWHVLDSESSEATKNRLNGKNEVPYTPPISEGATTELAIIKITTQPIHCTSKRISSELDSFIVFGTS